MRLGVTFDVGTFKTQLAMVCGGPARLDGDDEWWIMNIIMYNIYGDKLFLYIRPLYIELKNCLFFLNVNSYSRNIFFFQQKHNYYCQNLLLIPSNYSFN